MLLLTLISKPLFFAAGLFGIGFLITLHEIGHFVFCKLFNVSVPSFGLGFGPVLWEKKIGETNFIISAIPLGGYVEMAGSAEVGQGEQKEAYRDDERSLIQKPYWQKMCIMFGGVFLNFVFAYVAIILVLALGAPGTPMLPETLTNRIEKVDPNSPADKAGIQKDDLIVALNNAPFDTKNPQLFFEQLKTLAGQTASITINHGGTEERLNITFEPNKTVGMLGVIFATQPLAPRPFMQAIKEGIELTNKYIYNTALFIKQLFTRRSLEGTGGPVGIIAATTASAQQGFKVYLLLLAVISINLAVLNLLPLPILDGGQALFYTIEAIIRRRLPDNIKFGIHIACWALFLLLTIYLTYYDIKRIIVSFLCGA
jgi:regulator of sigma E protease